MRLGTGRRFRKFFAPWKRFRKVARDFHERSQFRQWHRLKDDVVTMLFDKNLRACEAEVFWQPDSLAAPVPKKFGSLHSYIL